MRIEIEQKDVHWATTYMPQLGNIRWLMITLGGKQFHVRREIDPMSPYIDSEKVNAEVDKLLIREMERMLVKFITQAASDVPDGPIDLK